MVHRRILDVAKTNPETPIDGLASMVAGANPNLVERVLEQYGDPGATDETEFETTAPMSKTEDAHGAEGESLRNHDAGQVEGGGLELSGEVDPRQLDTLRAIYDHPDASQRQLADLLDVSHSTISHRLNEIDGFEWENRWAIVKDHFEEADSGGCQSVEGEVADRLDRIERRVETLRGEGTCGLFADPELAHKILHACLRSEQISEDEELRILRTALPRSDE